MKKSPIVEFYSLLAQRLEHGEAAVPYAELMEVRRRTTQFRAKFDEHVFEDLTIEMRWNWRLPGQAIVEPPPAIRDRVQLFLRRAFQDLAKQRRDDDTAMQTYSYLARIVLREHTKRPVIWFEKIAERGPGATLLVHVSQLDTVLDFLAKHSSFGVAEGNGMMLKHSTS